jgi:hypothetical protein
VVKDQDVLAPAQMMNAGNATNLDIGHLSAETEEVHQETAHAIKAETTIEIDVATPDRAHLPRTDHAAVAMATSVEAVIDQTRETVMVDPSDQRSSVKVFALSAKSVVI